MAATSCGVVVASLIVLNCLIVDDLFDFGLFLICDLVSDLFIFLRLRLGIHDCSHLIKNGLHFGLAFLSRQIETVNDLLIRHGCVNDVSVFDILAQLDVRQVLLNHTFQHLRVVN